MSDENFFTRWSRRKAESAKRDAEDRDGEDATPQQPNAAAANALQSLESEARTPAQASGSPSAATAEFATFDPKDLPSIDSIGPDTDVSVFLRPGVPADLARAALRRAWTADPAIRDYIGLSENSWDFTAPQGVPGFGPLSQEDAQRLLAAFTGRTREVAATAQTADTQGPASSDAPQSEPQSEQSALGFIRNQMTDTSAEGADERLEACSTPQLRDPARGEENIAAQHTHIERAPQTARGKSPSRRSGGALPQ
jgi:hypothetical protein